MLQAPGCSSTRPVHIMCVPLHAAGVPGRSALGRDEFGMPSGAAAVDQVARGQIVDLREVGVLA